MGIKTCSLLPILALMHLLQDSNNANMKIRDWQLQAGVKVLFFEVMEQGQESWCSCQINLT
jgi:hypothetical protein